MANTHFDLYCLHSEVFDVRGFQGFLQHYNGCGFHGFYVVFRAFCNTIMADGCGFHGFYVVFRAFCNTIMADGCGFHGFYVVFRAFCNTIMAVVFTGFTWFSGPSATL